MAPLLRDYDIPMHCPCHAFAYRVGRGERNQADLPEKRRAVELFYARQTPDDVRAELIEKYGLRYIFAGPRRAAAIARDLAPYLPTTMVYDRGDALVKIQ